MKRETLRDCGVVIPTKGKRLDYLSMCIDRVYANQPRELIIVKSKNAIIESLPNIDKATLLIEEEGQGLASAINTGIKRFSSEVKFVTWIGDDDILNPDSLRATRSVLLQNEDASLVYGQCTYIDQSGIRIGKNHSGKWASKLLSVGPCLIPQPGSLIRRTSFELVDGLNESYKFAFDLELFLKLRNNGVLLFINEDLASFRWHPDSLTVSNRSKSFLESRSIRKKFMPPFLVKVSFFTEFINRFLINAVDFRLRRKSQNRANSQK